MDGSPRITHRDIARRAGCDKSTVSLALRGSLRVSEAVRKKIRGLADEMGYRPDPALETLSRQRWARQPSGRGITLAYLVAKKHPNYWRQSQHLTAARARAVERGYSLLEFDLSAYPTGEAASRVLYHRGIRGIVVPGLPQDTNRELQGFDWNHFTAVSCSAAWLESPFHLVTTDVFDGTRRVWREAVRRGYRRIGGAIAQHSPVSVDDFSRYGASCAEQAHLVRESDRLPLLLSHPDDRASFLTWFARVRPDAVIGSFESIHTWLLEAGYNVPGDVAFACLNVWPRHSFSGTSVQIDAVARAAIDYLVAQMHENQWGIPSTRRLLLLEPAWQEGDSLPARVDTAPRPGAVAKMPAGKKRRNG